MKESKIQTIGSIIIVGVLIIMMTNSLLFALAPKVLNKLHLTNDEINDFFQIAKSDISIDYSKI